MTGERILIVEDDSSIRALLTELLEQAGYETKAVSDGPKAIEAAKASVFHLYLIDLFLSSQMNGLDLLQEIRKINSQAVCIVLTGYGTIELSVKAMKSGAFDFITKPFQPDLVLSFVKTALEHYRLKKDNLIFQRTLHEKFRFENMVGSSPAILPVYELIEKVSDSDSTVLIQGESGTGKEIIAKTIHYNSPRKSKPFIPVNCGAIPESLLESELFGHEKGAFTGATSSRIGRFESAQGGSLFLDEVGEMPFPLQVKLLRAIQEREFERVGGDRSIRVDVRIIAATNQDLEQAVAEKRFRKDLFYRLNVIPLLVPPLRERREDIPLLVNYFLKKFHEKKPRTVMEVSPDALAILTNYSWPGNVRELENMIERLVTLKSTGAITKEDLPKKLVAGNEGQIIPEFEFPDRGIDFSAVVQQFEDHLIQQALLKANGVKNQAAHLLHLNRTTLVERLKRRSPPSPD
ncbi:MAG TPA: sigma-54 dependent transcriptional regulator [Nitrospiria bacterium]|nr:sigma-54 dependent transcriptional regulator [Nitrospiria bacterium]